MSNKQSMSCGTTLKLLFFPLEVVLTSFYTTHIHTHSSVPFVEIHNTSW